MNSESDSTRRRFLQGLTAAGAVGLASTPATAKNSGKKSLNRVPVYFTVYAGRGDKPAAFGFPDEPTEFRGYDINSQIFDSSDLDATPNGKTLHYGFRFFSNYALVGSPKPYIMRHTDGGTYESRGQTVNFELDRRAPAPFSFLGAGKWRAVGRDVVQLSEKGGEIEYAITRADFYDQGDGSYVLTLVYALWAPTVGRASDPRNPQADMPAAVAADAERFISDGRNVRGNGGN